MVVVIVVATIVDNEHQCLRALRPCYVYIYGMSVGGISHCFRLIKSIFTYHPAIIVALEQGEISIIGSWVGGSPNGATIIFIVHHLVSINTIFMHVVIFLIVEKRESESIILSHFATEEQRRMAYSPQRHHC